jgi:L-lactate dehydrogenase complex protein LldF
VTGVDLGMPSFPEAAREAVRDGVLRANLRHATHTIRARRARAVAELEDWDQLREAGRAVKDHTLRHLDRYLLQLEAAVTAAGGTVHWAADAEEANRIVTELVLATGEREVVKVKSMATQEIGLNEALEAAGIAAYETDLAELIVQLGHDRPSHILVPAIHRNRGEIRDIFRTEMGAWGRPARAGRGRPAAPAREVPAGPGRGVRGQLHGRGDRHPGGAGVRGERPDVPDPARDPDLRRRHREGRAGLP